MESISFNLTIVRHGESECNVRGGHDILHSATETPLTDLGRSQAEKVGQRLEDEKFDMVYSSDLSRAFDTCLAIVGDASRIVKDPRLRERHMGRFEGQPKKVLWEVAQKTMTDIKTMTSTAELLFKFEDDTLETYEDLDARVIDFLRDLIQSVVSSGTDGLNVLVTCHGFIIRAVLMHIAKSIKNDLPPLNEFQYKSIPNTGVSKFKFVVNRKNCEIFHVTNECFYCDKHLKD